jgi:GTP-binding protein
VAVVGAPNVGKSTLVNRVLGRRQAVVADEPGTTRDRSYNRAEWAGREFLLVDTGGMEPTARAGLEALVTLQARVAVEEADVILHVADGRLGATEADAAIARELRGAGERVVLAVNKLDNPADDTARYDFYALGEGEPHRISASHGIGIGDLLDEVVARLPRADGTPDEPSLPSIAVIGRPNVGKSTLLNRLVGSERAVVSEVAGTTTDAVAHEVEDEGGRRFRVLDTAGISRSAKRASGVPYYSTLKTEGAIRRADVSLLVVDATEGLVAEDLKLARQVEEAGRSLGLLLNKADLVDGYRMREIEADALYRLTDLEPPVLAVSALTGAGVEAVLPLAGELHEAYNLRVPTPEVARFVNEVTARVQPPKGVKIRYAVQAGAAPPRFVLFANRPQDVPDSYLRHVENALRERYGLRGVAVRLGLKSSR